jgi:hypothetical protein
MRNTQQHLIRRVVPIAAVLLIPLAAAELSFLPDFTYQGSGLAGWHSLGEAKWSGKNGELTAVATPGTGGWLMLDRSSQDVGFHASFRCPGTCKAGLLLRAEKTPEGIKGIFVSFAGGGVASYQIALDPQGRELHREILRRAGGAVRVAPPAEMLTNRRPRNPRSSPNAEVVLPFTRPTNAFRPGDWNEVEIFLDANIVRVLLNGGGEVGAAAEDVDGYGPIALYAGDGEVRFKDIAYKDLGVKVTPKEQVSPRFRMQRISDMYYSWSAAAADFNHDGILDVAAGPFIYFGPGFTKSREIYLASALNPSKDFTTANCEYAYDFNGDGWPDILTGPPRATLYINPKGESRRWDKYEVVPRIQSEITLFKDIDGDGKPELIYAADGAVRYAKPDPADPTKPWIVHAVSERGYGAAHGIGVGDVNGDGRMDIVNPYGWWEQPPPESKQELWTYHPEAFARYGRNIFGGSVMGVYDVNGDGLNDIVTALNAHGFGLAWFEQKRGQSGGISFVRHMISDDFATKNAGNVTFSEPHGSTFADVDGDGVPDFIVGKRYWSHLDDYLDPDPYGAPVLYWYRTVRNPKAPGGAEFLPELIDNRSGAGSDVLAVDLNKDGAVDIVTSTDRGTFIFWNRPRASH